MDAPVILVTGATGAIGFEIAAQAAAAGAVVGIHGSSPVSVAAAIERLRLRVPNAELIPAPADFHEAGAVEIMVEAFAHPFTQGRGRLDAVIHCAIIGAPGISGNFRNTNADNYGALADKVLATFQRLCFAALPHLSKRGGAILTFAADSGRFAAPRQALLGAVYGGLMAFVRNLALEVAREGVRINCISPSFVADTPIFERFSGQEGRAEAAQARAGLGLPTPADIAPMALFLCSAAASKITGQIISINGGMNA